MTRNDAGVIGPKWRCCAILVMLAASAGTASAMPIAGRGMSLPRDILHVADIASRPPHRNVYRTAPVGIASGADNDDAAWDQIFREAVGAFNTAVIDPRRKDFYRQGYFYGGTPYTGRKYYGAPVYYGGPYYTYYKHD